MGYNDGNRNAGRFKYRCDGCGETFRIARKQLTYRSKPRCPHCGCGRYEPVTRYAKDSMIAGDTARKRHKDLTLKRMGFKVKE